MLTKIEKKKVISPIAQDPLRPTFKQRFLGRKMLISFYAVYRDENHAITGLEWQGEKICKYGDELVEWKEREYKINYDLVIGGKKYFMYYTDVLSSIGGLSFFDWEERVKNSNGRINPSQAKEYHDAIVESAFVGSRGIPKMWFYILIIVAAIGVGGLVIMSLNYIGISQKYTTEHTTLCGIDPTHLGCPPPKVVSNK